MSGLFQAGQKAGLTNVVQLRSKRVFSTFPIGAKRKKHPRNRIPRGRINTIIFSGLFQAGQKAGLTNVVQLRSKRVFSTFPIGAKRKNTLRIKPTRSVSYHYFEWAFPSRAKSRVDERRPIAFRTRFFDFPHRGETKQHHWDRIPRGRFHTTILSGLFQAGQKAGLTNVVQLRSKRVFSTFPIGAKRKKHPRNRIPRGRFNTIILGGLFQVGQKAGLTNVVQLRSKRVFSTFPIGAKRKNTLRIEYQEVGFIQLF